MSPLPRHLLPRPPGGPQAVQHLPALQGGGEGGGGPGLCGGQGHPARGAGAGGQGGGGGARRGGEDVSGVRGED